MCKFSFKIVLGKSLNAGIFEHPAWHKPYSGCGMSDFGCDASGSGFDMSISVSETYQAFLVTYLYWGKNISVDTGHIVKSWPCFIT